MNNDESLKTKQSVGNDLKWNRIEIKNKMMKMKMIIHKWNSPKYENENESICVVWAVVDLAQ